jgi:E3 ubiquitin-protein ligase RFWD3
MSSGFNAGFESEDLQYECCICTSLWEAQGDHQVCCLPCGHLFGRSCVVKWLTQNPTCPQCVGQANVTQVRAVFCPKLCVIDNAEFKKLHIEASHAKLACMAAEEEKDKWQRIAAEGKYHHSKHTL